MKGRGCPSQVKGGGLKIRWVSPCAGSNPAPRILGENMRVLEKKILYDAGWFEVVSKKIDLGGKIVEWTLPSVKTDAVVIVPYDGKRVFLVEEWRASVEDYVLHLPIGGVEKSASRDKIIEQGKRELAEELKLTAKQWTFLFTVPSLERIEVTMHFLLAQDLEAVNSPYDGDEAFTIRAVKSFDPSSLLLQLLKGQFYTTMPTVVGLFALHYLTHSL